MLKSSSILCVLAHLDRCLFPVDFEQDLIELGLDTDMAMQMRWWVKEGSGIVEIYQRSISDEASNRILDLYVANWFKKFQPEYDGMAFDRVDCAGVLNTS